MTLPFSGLKWTHAHKLALTAPKDPGPCHSPCVADFCSIVHKGYMSFKGSTSQDGLYMDTPVTCSAIKSLQSILILIVLIVLC